MRKAEQFVVRKSNTKVHTKVGCGFLLGFDFRNLPDFRIPRNSSFPETGNESIFFRLSETKVRYESQILKLIKYFCIGETKVERSGYESPKQTNSREWVPGLSRGHRGAIRFMEDTCLQDLLCTCCMHRGIREGPGRIRRSCLCKHPYSASATECQQRWHKLAPSSDSLQYLKQLSSSRALLAAQDAPRLRIGSGQK